MQPDNLVLHLVPNKNTVPHTPGADPLREPVYGRSVIASWSTGTNPPWEVERVVSASWNRRGDEFCGSNITCCCADVGGYE